jgi:DNA-binding response OmpR family regulator
MPENKRIEELEDENALLKQQLKAITGESQELGVLMAQGMTHTEASILYILVKRAPAVVSRASLHSIMYGDRSDGGPEPKIFDVRVSRLRRILKREECKGKIDTVWNAGYRANPELVRWVQKLYQDNIPQEK